MCQIVTPYKLLNCNFVLLVIVTQNSHKSIATDSGYADETSVGTTGTDPPGSPTSHSANLAFPPKKLKSQPVTHKIWRKNY